MTRINLVPVEELSDQHLLSEAREIKRIPNVINSGRFNLDNIPEKYTMGKGHVKFFYNKLGFLQSRYLGVYRECKKRGFNVENYIKSFFTKENTVHLFNLWEPTEEDIATSRQRIQEKLALKPNYYRWTSK
jgi:deoxyribonuclease (pyrimidine dimer)